MSPELHILKDLLAGQATAGSIAGRCRLHTEAVEIILTRLATEKKVTSRPLAEVLTVWTLAPETKATLTAKKTNIATA